MRLNFYRFPEGTDNLIKQQEGLEPDEDTLEGITVTHAKKLLKKYGGAAWTQHIDRDGSCFEVTEITLGGNNSSFKYNRHL